MKIAIIHLDLGQGGAERQTIDEAIALKANGHDVTIFTSHHDPNRCFAETIDKSFECLSCCKQLTMMQTM